MYVGHTSISTLLLESSRFGFMRGNIVGKSLLRRGQKRNCYHFKVRFHLGGRKSGQGVSLVLGVPV